MIHLSLFDLFQAMLVKKQDEHHCIDWEKHLDAEAYRNETMNDEMRVFTPLYSSSIVYLLSCLNTFRKRQRGGFI